MGAALATSGRGRVYAAIGWLAGCVREGLQPPHLFSCTREFARSERGSAKSTLMVEGGHVSHHGSGCCPFLFNQSGEFTGCGGWRFAHAVSLNCAKHAGIEVHDRKLRVRSRKMCGGPESYPVPKQEEEQGQNDHDHSRDESQHAWLERSGHARQPAEDLADRGTQRRNPATHSFTQRITAFSYSMNDCQLIFRAITDEQAIPP